MEAVLWFFTAVVLRPVALAAAAVAGIAIVRIRTAASLHAVWTIVAIGMPLLALMMAVATPIPVRVLRAEAPQVGQSAAAEVSSGRPSPTAAAAIGSAASIGRQASPAATLGEIAMGLYVLGAGILLARLGFGYLFTRRMVKSAAPTGLEPGVVLESSWISVPLALGWLRPKILLPADWRDWPAEKLAAVLAHERSHVRRSDWAIALLAAVNRCVYWFHPLAWWLDRKVASLAEHACDDAALLELGSREPYAQALLDMALAVKNGRGRMVWEAIAMARASEVRVRVERVLDESRQIPRGFGGRRWATLVLCSLPLIYLTSVLHLAPANAQVQDPVSGGTKMAAADAAAMEQQLTVRPDDLQLRGRLIGYYFLSGIREPRLGHILWLVEHHPESEIAAFNAGGISPQPNSLNTAGDYQRVATLWRQQVAAHADDERVLVNAAQFFSQPGGDLYEAERLLQQAANIQPNGHPGRTKLTSFYVRALKNDDSFAQHVGAELDTSSDGLLLRDVALELPLMPDRSALRDRMLARARQFGVTAIPPRAPLLAPRALPPPPPPVLHKVEAEYPAAARSLRLSGNVRVHVTTGPDGRVTSAAVMAGHPVLAQSAVDAVKQWTFAPVLQNGPAVAADFAVTVDFPLPPDLKAQVYAEHPMPSRIRVGGNVQKAMLVSSTAPIYPAPARTAGPSGDPPQRRMPSNSGNTGPHC